MYKLSIGDVIYVDRGLYKHYGVYVGKDAVVEFAPDKGFELDAMNAHIRRTTIKDFLKGAALHIDKSCPHRYSGEEIARRALCAIGTQRGRYDLITNNCEHFAKWCASGKPKSKQVDSAIGTASAIALGTVAIAAGVGIAKAIIDNTLGDTDS